MSGRLAYLVHDTNDAAVARRVAMFAAAGAATRVGGFSRRAPPTEVQGAAVTDLGRTVDLDLPQRVLAVVRNLAFPRRARTATRNADMIVARNLEMLAIAARVRRRDQRLIYECLDIHRMMLGEGRASRALRALERWLLARTDLVLTSSPAFEAEYFRGRQAFKGAVRLVENKVPALDGSVPKPKLPLPGPPWRIGWLGMLRCARSLTMLERIAADPDARAEVLIAGRPLEAELPDLAARTAPVRNLAFRGAYQPSELSSLYGGLHFIWCVDYFEAGLNSAWLLPNRLYEGMVHGAVPLAEEGTEIARWLHAHDAGVVFTDLMAELPGWLAALRADRYRALRAKVDAVPRAALVLAMEEARSLLASIAGW